MISACVYSGFKKTTMMVLAVTLYKFEKGDR